MAGTGRIINDAKIDAKIDEMLKEMPEFATAWNFDMKADKKAASTRHDYLIKLRKFLAFVGSDNPGAITREKVQQYRVATQEKRSKSGEISKTSTAYQIAIYNFLKTFLDFMVRSGRMKENYMDGARKPEYLDLPRIQRERPEFTENDFKAILHQPKEVHDEFVRTRDSAILSVILTTGIRETEVINLMLNDIDMANGILTVVGKREEEHQFFISGEMKKDLIAWMQERKGISTKDKHLFITQEGKDIPVYDLAYIVRKYTKKALGKEYSPHKLRAGVISMLINKTQSVDFARRYIGHKWAQTTERYAPQSTVEKRKGAGIMDAILS